MTKIHFYIPRMATVQSPQVDPPGRNQFNNWLAQNSLSIML